METMTLTIHVPKNIGAILEEKAKSHGITIEEYIVNLIKQDIGNQEINDHSPKNIQSVIF